MDDYGITIIDVDEPEPVTESDAPALSFPTITREFLFAGRAYFVVANPKGERLIYMLKGRVNRPGSQWAGTISYFLSVFTANGSTYRFVGVVDPFSGALITVGRSMFLVGSREFDVAQWAIRNVLDQTAIAPGYAITHNQRCGRCGMTLVSRGDRESGLHLDCADPSH